MEVYEILHDNENFYLACEVCKGGELEDLVTKGKKFDEKIA